jgi:hypothetical protein
MASWIENFALSGFRLLRKLRLMRILRWGTPPIFVFGVGEER